MAYDEFSNRRLQGGDVFVVEFILVGAEESTVSSRVEITDFMDGTYLVNFTITGGGRYTIVPQLTVSGTTRRVSPNTNFVISIEETCQLGQRRSDDGLTCVLCEESTDAGSDQPVSH